MKYSYLLFFSLIFLAILLIPSTDAFIWNRPTIIEATLNVNHSETSNSSNFWDSLDTPTDILHSDLSNLAWSVAGHTMDTFLNMNEQSIVFANLVSANSMTIWDDNLNEDAILTMYTHDVSNAFTLSVTDAGATDFFSQEQYQIRSGDDLFQIIQQGYTGTYLNIDVGNTNPEITSKDGIISFVGDNLTTTGNITASWFNGKFNWTTGDTWNIFDGSTLTFNESKLSSTYYNATQSNLIKGIIDGGSLINTQHPDANYDGITLNFSEESGSPALELRVNFTGVEDFSRGVMRYKTGSLSGDYPLRQLWNYDTSNWETLTAFTESEDFVIITMPIFNSVSYVQDGVVQLRIYKSSNGNTNNHYYVDWVAMVGGYGVPSGQEVDPIFSSWLNDPIFEYNINASDVNSTWDWLTATNLNITGSAYIGDLTWNGNLDLGGNNITNIGKINATDWTNISISHLTTDDLAEGSTYLYDNSSWNETYANTLYYGIGNPFGFYNSSTLDLSDYWNMSEDAHTIKKVTAIDGFNAVSDELIDDWGFDGAGNWTGNDWTISSSQAVHAPVGASSLTETSPFTPVNLGVYVIVVNISDNDAGGLDFVMCGNTKNYPFGSDGLKSFVFTCSNTNTLSIDQLGGPATLESISIKKLGSSTFGGTTFEGDVVMNAGFSVASATFERLTIDGEKGTSSKTYLLNITGGYAGLGLDGDNIIIQAPRGGDLNPSTSQSGNAGNIYFYTQRGGTEKAKYSGSMIWNISKAGSMLAEPGSAGHSGNYKWYGGDGANVANGYGLGGNGTSYYSYAGAGGNSISGPSNYNGVKGGGYWWQMGAPGSPGSGGSTGFYGDFIIGPTGGNTYIGTPTNITSMSARLQVNGSIFSNENVTASYFIGDGSQLTGISSGSADGTGGWTNTTTETNTSLNVNINGDLYAENITEPVHWKTLRGTYRSSVSALTSFEGASYAYGTLFTDGLNKYDISNYIIPNDAIPNTTIKVWVDFIGNVTPTADAEVIDFYVRTGGMTLNKGGDYIKTSTHIGVNLTELGYENDKYMHINLYNLTDLNANDYFTNLIYRFGATALDTYTGSIYLPYTFRVEYQSRKP